MLFLLAQNRTHCFSMIAAVLRGPSIERPNLPALSTARPNSFRRGTEYSVLGTGISLARHDANIGQVTVALGVIESIANNELIGNSKPDIVALQRQFAPRGLVEQSCDLQRARLMR